MTVSNSTTFSMTRDQIITQALVLLGIYAQGDTINANDISFCANSLNMMVKAWEGQGFHLWTAQEGAVFLNLNYQKYDLASGSTTCIAGDDPVYTTLTTTASGTALVVGTTVNMNVSDNIGIKLDTGLLFWTTIATIVDGFNLTLNLTLPSQASSGTNIFVFTNRIDRPLQITSARNKTFTGKVNSYYYSPHVSDSTLYVWPTADNTGDSIRITYTRRIQDFVASGDTPDLPQEWLEPIVYNLCLRIASSYGISTQKLNPDIAMLASSSLAELRAFDSEAGSVNLVTNYRYDD